MNALDTLRLLSPDLILALTGFLVVAVDLIRRRRDDGRTAAIVALLGLALALAATIYLILTAPATVVATTMVVDPYALFFKAVAIIGVGMVVFASINFMAGRSRYLGEYYALLVFAALAISVAVSATNFLLVYLGIEFLSITSYILAGFLRHDMRSQEAAMKYFLYGATSGAVLLYGISLLYGATGSTDLAAVGQVFQTSPTNFYLGLAAIVLLLGGFGFKASLVPFHQWAPDTYDGAPTPVTAFLSTASKAAGFAVAGRVFMTAMPDWSAQWTMILAALSMLTMTLGNLVALKQTSVKRMLAYSSIAQAGYILMGLAASGGAQPFDGVSGLLVYIFAYLFTNVGAFLVVMAVEKQTGSNDYTAFGGLIRRAPVLALLMTVFMLSLAGIPPTGGFLGKFLVFGAAVRQDMLALAAVGAINAVIAAFYYLNVVRYMFFVEAPEGESFKANSGLRLALVVSAIMVLLIGIFAQPVLTWATNSVTMAMVSGF